MTSTFSYCVSVLKLSEERAYSLIRVARKAIEVPALKEAITEGKVTLSNAKKIASVIPPETQTQWLEKAQNLKQRDLEREISRALPEEKKEVRILGLSKALEEKLTRVQEILG